MSAASIAYIMLTMEQGFEVIKQLLGGQQSYRFILGCRDANGVKTAFESLKYDQSKHSVETIPLNLSDLRTVRSFASEALSQLQGTKLDYVLLNAGMTKAATEPGVNGSKWCESYVVNHLCAYLIF